MVDTQIIFTGSGRDVFAQHVGCEFVVPRFASMLAETGGQLPMSTRLLVNVSHLLTRWWWLWIGLGLAGGQSLISWIRTGRNRARWHGARLRWPIVGDPLYGGGFRLPAGASEPLREVLRAFKRQALHAETLAFAHPRTGEEVRATAPVPEDFKALLEALRTI